MGNLIYQRHVREEINILEVSASYSSPFCHVNMTRTSSAGITKPSIKHHRASNALAKTEKQVSQSDRVPKANACLPPSHLPPLHCISANSASSLALLFLASRPQSNGAGAEKLVCTVLKLPANATSIPKHLYWQSGR